MTHLDLEVFSCYLLVSLGIQFLLQLAWRLFFFNRKGRILVNKQIVAELADEVIAFEWLTLQIREIYRSYVHITLSHLSWCVSFLTWPFASCWYLGGFLEYLQILASHSGLSLLLLGEFILKHSLLYSPNACVPLPSFLFCCWSLGALGSDLQTEAPAKCYKIWSGPQELKL